MWCNVNGRLFFFLIFGIFWGGEYDKFDFFGKHKYSGSTKEPEFSNFACRQQSGMTMSI